LSLGQERRQSDSCRKYSPHKRAIARHINRSMKGIYVCACIRQVREQIGKTQSSLLRLLSGLGGEDAERKEGELITCEEPSWQEDVQTY
jgi:hypothetical protein